MTDRVKKDGFIMQAGILAVAGILSRIIGLLYNSPMTAIIGDEGNGYYELAYRAYTIVLLVSSYSIPSAISKVVAGYLAAGEYRNAHRI
ncbi:MAG: oligosaccharide flippase family protein, partial [Lachnospiraceae bacterium]|nr:oligosaccharide flippase family protein [Lachnospiraceae bacterium]